MSKLVTAVTIMHLVEQGKLSVDQPAFALLTDLEPPAGAKEASRLAGIRIRHLLTHSGAQAPAGLTPGWVPVTVFREGARRGNRHLRDRTHGIAGSCN